MPCRWRKVASVEIISLSGVHHLFYDFVFVIVSYTLSFFFRNFKSKRIANNFLNQKTGVLFSKLSERNAWMIPNLCKKRKIYFCFIYMYILFFSGVNNIPDGFSDNWKEAKFNKIDPYQSGFFPLTETISFHFSFSQCRKHWVEYTYHR